MRKEGRERNAQHLERSTAGIENLRFGQGSTGLSGSSIDEVN